MDHPPPSVPSDIFQTTYTVLVTGANSGLGFAICTRLIDEFLFTRPQSQTLHLLFTTRDAAKSSDTLARLHAHFQKTLREADARTKGISLLLEKRVKIEGLLVDLLRLGSVRSLAEELVRRGQRFDACVWNAGIAGWKGRRWGRAVWDVMTRLVEATTYPEYNVADVGAVARRQGGGEKGVHGGEEEEPKLGQVFLANVFGHYMLTHWLAPLFTPESRIIWVSSISAVPSTFFPDDLQGLRSEMAYEGSKRLTDLLVLTSELPSTAPYTSSFLPSANPEKPQPRPRLLLTHPGVIGTSIASLNPILTFLMLISFHIARLLGSPWHPIDPYKGSISAVFAALAPASQLTDFENRDGKGKWGSSTGLYGEERVARTEVEGWGYCGVVGKVPDMSLQTTRGRYRGYRPTTKERREEFEDLGRKLWAEMEDLRREWEERLGYVGIPKG